MKNGQSRNTRPRAAGSSFFCRHRGLKVFLITFACCAAAFSAAAASLLYYMKPSGFTTVFKNTAKSVSESSEQRKVTASGSFTMLICVYSDSDGEPVEFMLYRLDGAKGRTVIVPLSEKLAVSYQSGAETLRDIYKKSGISAVSGALQNFLSAKINYTCTIGSGNFLKIFEKLGGLYGSVPQDLTLTVPGSSRETVLKTSPRQYLSGTKIYILIASPSYTSDEQRYRQHSVLMKEFVAEKLTGLYMKNAPGYFGDILNYVDTAFSMNDLLKYKDAIMSLSSESSIETPLPQYSSISGGLLTMANADNIKRFFH